MKIKKTIVQKVVKTIITVLSAFLGALGGTTLGAFAIMAIMQL